MKWKNDNELFELAETELFTSLVGDVMDTMGYYHQFLPQPIKPLRSSMKVIGRAMPVLECDVYNDSLKGTANRLMEKPFGLMFEALDDLKEGEVYVCTGASPTYALWGGLMTTRAKILGARGAIVNGSSRDTPEILASGFNVFSTGTYAQDQGVRGKVVDYRLPVEIDGIRIETGDIVFGDLDGVIVVPRKLEEDVFNLALNKGREEKKVLKALKEGLSTVEAYAKFGIM